MLDDRRVVGLEAARAREVRRRVRRHANRQPGARHRRRGAGPTRDSRRSSSCQRRHAVPDMREDAAKRLQRKIAGRIKGDQPAAGLHEHLQRLDAGLADSSLVLRRHRAPGTLARPVGRLVAVDDAPGSLVGQDDHVEAIAAARPGDVGVGERRVREPVLFEQPPGPSLVHVGDPALVQTNPGRAQRRDRDARQAIDPLRLDAIGGHHVGKLPPLNGVLDRDDECARQPEPIAGTAAGTRPTVTPAASSRLTTRNAALARGANGIGAGAHVSAGRRLPRRSPSSGVQPGAAARRGGITTRPTTRG